MVRWSASGGRLAVVSDRVEVFDTTDISQDALARPNAPSVSISPDGRHVALGGLGREIPVWDLTELRLVPALSLRLEEEVIEVAYSPCGRWIAAAVGDGRKIAVWEVRKRQRVATLEGNWAEHRGAYYTWPRLAWESGGYRLAGAGGGDDDRVTDVFVWAIPDGELLRQMPAKSPYHRTEPSSRIDPTLQICSPYNLAHPPTSFSTSR